MELILKEKDLEEISAIIREFPLKYGIQVLDFLNNKHAIQQQILAENKALQEQNTTDKEEKETKSESDALQKEIEKEFVEEQKGL